MQVEQAVFTSTRSKKSQGYHLVAMSPGVPEVVARILTVWGPSHSALLSPDPDAQSLNFHPVVHDWFAISRTVHGGPEYSGRGGFEVYTRFLLLRADQLEGYRNNPLPFARTAQALGHLRFQAVLDESLAPIDMPDHPIADVPPSPEKIPVPLQDVLRLLKIRNRVAVLGLADPLPTLSRIIKEMPMEERLGISFSTGLRPSVDREFRIHFADRPDSALFSQLASHGIDYVTAT